jgi:hypothetical protein
MNTKPEVATQRRVIHSATADPSHPFPVWKRLIVGGLAALLPKCFGCVAGWLALVAGIRTIAPEICGETAGTLGFRTMYFWMLATILLIWAIPIAWKWTRRISFRPARVILPTAARRIR